MRVLVVEDKRDLADAIAGGLRREGYAVDLAHAGDEALVKARVYPYDLICLDLGRPGAGGREVCRAIRAEDRADGAPQPRILMLTARGSVEDRIAGLDDGADDYLVKPFELGELAARARALLRRPGDGARPPLGVGYLELDPVRHEATQAGEPLALTPKEFALLRYFGDWGVAVVASTTYVARQRHRGRRAMRRAATSPRWSSRASWSRCSQRGTPTANWCSVTRARQRETPSRRYAP